jgi:hypothetical protein
MNPDKQKALIDVSRWSPFWVVFTVFLLLAGDYGLRLANLVSQRQQLNEAWFKQVQNTGVLTQAQQLERRLESLSLDLLQLAKTNTTAKQIVQDFNIQWTPSSTAPAPAAAATNQQK